MNFLDITKFKGFWFKISALSLSDSSTNQLQNQGKDLNLISADCFIAF